MKYYCRLITYAVTFSIIMSFSSVVSAATKICFVTFTLQVAYFQKSVAGGEAAAKELGVDIVVMDPQADAARQVSMVEDCIAQQSDGIVVDPIESSALMGVIGEAGSRIRRRPLAASTGCDRFMRELRQQCSVSHC